MPLVYQQNINESTKMAVWHIAEAEDFFLAQVPLQKNISHGHKRLQHLAGRLLLKEMFPAFPVALIQVADTKKPYLEEDPFHFSISHCGDYAAAIVSREYRVGVDIEMVNDKIGILQKKFLSEAEMKMLNAQFLMPNDPMPNDLLTNDLMPNDPMTNDPMTNDPMTNDPMTNDQCLTLCWSVKESVFKWWGKGSVDFKRGMVLQSVRGDHTEGKVHCLFKNETELLVHYLSFNNNFLTWVLTDH